MTWTPGSAWNFKSPTNRAPRKFTSGKPGEERTLRLELKLIADVGLIGYPSVGKSTIIAAISSARPKTGAYHFTTLAPNLGVVDWKNSEPFVVADIPGLIEGAHEGQGLGIQFLKHVERTNLLVHVIEVCPAMEGVDDGRDPLRDFEVICGELKKFNEELSERPQLVVLNKIDLPFVAEQAEELKAHFTEELDLPFLAISAATQEGIEELKDYLAEAVSKGRFEREPEAWEE
jgi:GTPase